MRRIIIRSVVLAVSGLITSVAYAEPSASWVDKILAKGADTATPAREKSTRKIKTKIEISGVARLPSEVAAKPMPSSGGCVPAQLQAVLNDVEAKFGAVRITSSCRSASANRAAGGAPQSLHLIGQAIDFRVSGGNTGAVWAFLTAHSGVGGLKHYGGGLFHIDTGDRRPF